MKLLELQKKLEPIKKDMENPFHKSKYFDINKLLEVLKPIFNEMNILVTQPLVVVDGKSALKTLLVDMDNNEVISESVILLPDLPDPQKVYAGATYYRRLSLQCALCLEAEDDDGNTASGKGTEKQVKANQDFESQGLVRFNAPFIDDKAKFKALTDYLKENGSKFDLPNKCWWIKPEVETVLKKKFNQD